MHRHTYRHAVLSIHTWTQTQTQTQAQDPEARKKNPFGRAGPVRPPAKAFNPEEARELALLVARVPGSDGQIYLQLGSNRFINGYLEKNMVMRVGSL